MNRPADPSYPLLPEWDVSTWLNTPAPITLASLRGKVVLVHTFQMLCPGCVAYGLPQAERVRRTFPASELAVVGLHTVFEHHAVMSVDALRAFIHEYRWSFPIGVDAPDGRGGPSRTMTRYGLHGTPSSLVLDRQGRVRLHHFGKLDDLVLGDLLGRMIAGGPAPRDGDASKGMHARFAAHADAVVCEPAGCGTRDGARQIP